MTTTTATTSTTSTDTTASKTATSRKTLNANFDTFLQMLTTQMQYQDPLNPVDTAQFTNQLVMYSQVEQQLSTNDKLDSMINLLQGQGVNSALNYLGWQVSSQSSTLPLQGSNANFDVTLESAAKSVTIGIYDSDGKLVRGLTVDGSKFTAGKAQEMTWDGKDNEGDQLADGTYTVRINATAESGSAVKSTINTYGVVTGISQDSSGNTVLEMGTAQIDPSAVKSVRAYTAPATASSDSTSTAASS